MSGNAKKRTVEYVIYILFWSVLLLSPFLGAFIRNASFLPTMDEMFSFWDFLLPAIVLFFVNNNILMPFLLYKKKGRLFVLYLLCIIVSFSIIFISFPAGEPPLPKSHLHSNHVVDTPDELHAQQACKEDVATSYVWKTPDKRRPPFHSSRHPGIWMFFVDPRNVQILITVVVLVFNICVRLFFFTIRRDEHYKELEKEKLLLSLEHLRYQINPHFFMNTLNNIHALIDIDKGKAQKAIHEFSKMMRYVLYDTSVSLVPLEKEVSFINGYIDLMRLRYTDKLEIRTDFVADTQGVYVPPMLFMSFVENAFKHGVTYKKKSVIDVALMVDDEAESVVFTCRNTMPEKPNAPFPAEQGGIGVENARKRLALLFGEKATLRINSESGWYNVELKMPVEYDKVYNS